VLQQQLIDQLGSCTATSFQLQQQLLRQQHHTPVVLAVLDNSSMLQLAACGVLLLLCLICFTQVGVPSMSCVAAVSVVKHTVLLWLFLSSFALVPYIAS
jgi:hypothetical protein